MYEQYLFKTPLNEISDNFIKKKTGVNDKGSHVEEFNNPNNNGIRNKRITAALFRNLANQYEREEKSGGGQSNGKITLNKRDPYAIFHNREYQDKLDKKFGTIEVNGIHGLKNHAYGLTHPQFGVSDYYKQKENAIAALQPKKKSILRRLFG